jgi:hypothetical protein
MLVGCCRRVARTACYGKLRRPWKSRLGVCICLPVARPSRAAAGRRRESRPCCPPAATAPHRRTAAPVSAGVCARNRSACPLPCRSGSRALARWRLTPRGGTWRAVQCVHSASQQCTISMPQPQRCTKQPACAPMTHQHCASSVLVPTAGTAPSSRNTAPISSRTLSGGSRAMTAGTTTAASAPAAAGASTATGWTACAVLRSAQPPGWATSASGALTDR